MSRATLRSYGKAGATVATLLLGWLTVNALSPSARLTRTLLSRGMYLADFWNERYRICFPPEVERDVGYPGQESDYLVSEVSPNGHSLFAVRRVFDGRSPSQDVLVRRSLGDAGGSEKLIPSMFQVIQDFAISPNEKFAVVGGRLRLSHAEANTDGIFLWDFGSGSVIYAAPYFVGANQDSAVGTQVRSLNVDDHGGILYEDNGTVVRLEQANRRIILRQRHPGEFPALLPSGDAYIFVQGGRLFWSNDESKRELLRVPQVLGGIRVSPDSQFVAFGRNTMRIPLSEFGSRLMICELSSHTCIDGPTYFEKTAARQTFWVKANR